MVRLLRLDRNLLTVYLVALLALFLLPISGPQFSLLDIESDKWTHVGLFAGLCMLVRWNLESVPKATLISVAATVMFAAAIEGIQSLLAYRSAEWADLLAGSVGALLGVAVTNRVLSSSAPDKPFGILIIILGIMAGVISALADVIGVSRQDQFGPYQLAGIVLGVVIVAGGIRVYKKGWHVSP